MDFPLYWLLLALPVAFLAGWAASRLDLRQWKRDRRDAPRAYFDGLNLLLNEQQDKAIDAFIEAVQLDPDTTELHFALGNLFRRRGEFERAVRVHQHLLARADLARADRDRAQHALAQDFMKAGLFDRAEGAWQALRGTGFEDEALAALLQLHERSRDWTAATRVAEDIERHGGVSMATRIAHHHCERALDAEGEGRAEDAAQALAEAQRVAPAAPRPWLVAGEQAMRAGDPLSALAAWDRLRERAPSVFALVAADYARAAAAADRREAALAVLQASHEAEPRLELLTAMAELDPAGDAERRLANLTREPSVGAAASALEVDPALWQPDTRARLHAAVQRAAAPLQRYRCAACGFEAHHFFWQCPGCQAWDSFPPRRLESL